MATTIATPEMVREQTRDYTLKAGNTVHMRTATTNDYEAIMEILHLVTRCCVRHSPEVVERIFSDKNFIPIVAENGGKIVSYGALYVLEHLGRPPFSRLEHVVVAPEYRNQGIGQSLCLFASEIATVLGCERIDLTVENPVARHIYVNMGFEHVTTEMMRKSLIDIKKYSQNV